MQSFYDFQLLIRKRNDMSPIYINKHWPHVKWETGSVSTPLTKDAGILRIILNKVTTEVASSENRS